MINTRLEGPLIDTDDSLIKFMLENRKYISNNDHKSSTIYETLIKKFNGV